MSDNINSGKLKELESILQKSSDDLNAYLESLQMQQNALIKSNSNELEKSLLIQEKMLNSISENQNTTAFLMETIIKESKLEPKKSGFIGFLECIKHSKNEYIVLYELREKISGMIKKIIETNNKNKILLDHSRNFIKEVVSALTNQGKPVIDRKI
jgi:hypothetical protein